MAKNNRRRRKQKKISLAQQSITTVTPPKKPSLPKTAGIMTTGAFLAFLSIAVYIATTEGQELDIVLSSILINYLQNFLAAFITIPNIGSTAWDIFSRGLSQIIGIIQALRGYSAAKEPIPLLDNNLLPRPGLLRQTIKLFGGLPLAFIFSIPGTATTYESSKANPIKALSLAIANYAGTVPLFLLSTMKMIDNEGRLIIKSISNLIQWFFPGNDQEIIKNLNIVNDGFGERLQQLLDTVYRGELTNRIFPFDGTAKDKLVVLARMLNESDRLTPRVPGYFDKLYSVITKVSFVYPLTLIIGATAAGYACSTGGAFLFAFLYFSTLKLLVGNGFLSGLYYLGAKGAKDVSQKFVSWIQDLLHGDFKKAVPDIVRFAPNWFRGSRWLIAGLITFGVAVLASRSGFTARELYNNYCVGDKEGLFLKTLDELLPEAMSNFFKEYFLSGSLFNAVVLEVIDQGTVIFNLIYGYLTAYILMQKLKEFRGSLEERFDIGLIDFLKNLITELPLFTKAQTQELFVLLSQLQPDQRQVLLGTVEAVSAADNLARFSIHRAPLASYGTTENAGSYSSIPETPGFKPELV